MSYEGKVLRGKVLSTQNYSKLPDYQKKEVDLYLLTVEKTKPKKKKK